MNKSHVNMTSTGHVPLKSLMDKNAPNQSEDANTRLQPLITQT